ncbi:serine/threonine protein kinase [Indiicoccus explosivorum]|uniref:serine/threonine protein kinase n=1 Tax=Indiicoccus explosivorum TaxID=1917864 RepID=UPI000B43B264|nr:serine/threonine protein kinase [Indiicoccus explosivorum]
MTQRWEKAAAALQNTVVTPMPNNEPVVISEIPEGIRCIGIGTDAAVFQSVHAPEIALKVYAEEKKDKAQTEKEVYDRLGSSGYFPKCYGTEGRILALSMESGITLFDCLLQGVHVPRQAIQDVEDARNYVRSKGLNPRDIHLKNILLQEGRAKILDVSEYVLPGNDYRWEHLKRAYDEYYPLLDGRPMPFWLLETIRKWYNQWNRYHNSFEEFMKHVYRHTAFRK